MYPRWRFVMAALCSDLGEGVEDFYGGLLQTLATR